MIMSRFGTASFWISKKFLNNVGRGILSQSRMHVLKNCPGGLAPNPSTSISPVILACTFLALAVGIRICYHSGRNLIK